MRWVGINGVRYALSGPQPYRYSSQSVMVPRQDLAGVPGAENLRQAEWHWSLSDFSGGEGQLVFDKNDPEPPHYRITGGAVDTRVSGEIKMSPVATVNTAVAASTTTRFEGNTLTDSIGTSTDDGTDTVIGTDITTWAHGELTGTGGPLTQLNPAMDPGEYLEKTGRTPGAVGVRVVFLIRGYSANNVAYTVRVRNDTDGTTTTSATGNVDTTLVEVPLTFTGVAGKSYSYRVTNSDGSDLLFVSSITETVAVVEEVVQGSRTPGATTVTVTARVTGSDAAVGASLRVRNATGAADVTTTTSTATTSPTTLTASYTAVAATTYEYYVKKTSTEVETLSVDFVEEVTGAGQPIDVRGLAHGQGNNVWSIAADGVNSDVFYWDNTDNLWAAAASNVTTDAATALASSDRYLYVLFANGIVFRITTVGATQYTSAPAGTATGLAVANNRLYVLTTTTLTEYDLDQTAGLPLAGTTKAAAGTFYQDETADQSLAQRMTGTGAGVRFFTNVRGGPTTIWEYADGATSPIATLDVGYNATAIFHYGGVTWIAVQFTTITTSGPNEKRSGIYYISQDGVPRFLGYLRFHDPDETRVQYITAYGHSIFFLQGNKVWRYDAGSGGLTLDLDTGSSTPANARGLAVLDRKMFAAYAGQGTFVSQNTYPVAQTVYVESPIWDFDVPDHDKTLLHFHVITKPLPANTSVSLGYKVDEASSWTTATAPASASTEGDTTHIFEVSDSDATTKGRILQWRVGLRSSDGVDSPTVRSVTTGVYVNDYEEVFELSLNLSDDDPVNRLGGQQLSATQKAALLRTLRDSKSVVSFEDHYLVDERNPADFETFSVVVEDPTFDFDEGRGTARVRLRVVA